MNRRWLVNKTNQEFLEYLSKQTSISTALTQILVNRGFKDLKSIKDFLSPSLQTLHDPFLMPDMEMAVERINTAREKGETLLVHGDYDADGITSTALLVSAFRILGFQTHYFIPNRITDGYGLNEKGIQRAQSLGARLMITADCGISSLKEVSIAASHGIDIIITDHHEPPEILPEATAIINPHRADSAYPFKNLAGVGVAFKLVQALLGNSHMEDFLDLVALGTIADSVPLLGENRILATYGIKALNASGSAQENPSKPWIHALKETARIGSRKISSKLLSFTIIPRINAVGRLGDPNEVVELFLTHDMVKAKGIAAFMDEQNKKRQKIEEGVRKSAIDMIDADNLDNAIVLYSPEWHPGVVGTVASRLVDMFYRPVFLFSEKDNILKGSARSIPPFNLFKGITECSDLLLAYGGHAQAAGIKIHTENLSAFTEQINSIIENTLSTEDRIPTIEIDAGIDLFKVNHSLLSELELLEPFGVSNRKPVFGAKKVEILAPRVVGNNHLKMKSKQKSVIIDTIGFRMADFLKRINESGTVDIAFIPSINEWNGNRILQLNLRAVRPSL